MGIVVNYGEETLSFDTFHDYYKPQFVHPHANFITSWLGTVLYQKTCPSHSHTNHFDPKLTLHFLEQHQERLVHLTTATHKVHPAIIKRLASALGATHFPR